jgi:pimeloyl-ACP methyl ester carboxylesterase
MQKFELPDGRLIAYETWGDETGKPVLFNHGTGDSRLARNPRERLTEELGVNLITVDRPGVGGSSQNPNRSILDWAADIEALADFLSLDRFALAGHSTGGPHALGIAHRLGDRVNGIALASPLGPLDEPGAMKMLLNKDMKTVALLRHTLDGGGGVRRDLDIAVELHARGDAVVGQLNGLDAAGLHAAKGDIGVLVQSATGDEIRGNLIRPDAQPGGNTQI